MSEQRTIGQTTHGRSGYSGVSLLQWNVSQDGAFSASTEREYTMSEQRMNGYSGTSLLLMFLGGALAGAAAAYLGQADNRARIRTLANRAGQLPQSVREASHAAKEAFVEAYSSSQDEADVVLTPKHRKA